MHDQYGLNFELILSDEVANAMKSTATLQEDSSKTISCNNNNLNSMIIESDNYAAMKALLPEYEGKIDCLLLDPPYFTGRKLTYTDNFRDNNLEYRYSKWCSMISPILPLAYSLLSTSGVLIANVDERTVSHMDLMCQKIFSPKNRIGHIPIIVNLRGNNNQLAFSGIHEYFLIYAKCKSEVKVNKLFIPREEVYLDWEEDDIGIWKESANLMAYGPDSLKEDSPNLYFPVFIKHDNDEIYITKNNKPLDQKDIIVWPISYSGEKHRWYWSKGTFTKRKNDVLIKKSKERIILRYKQRPDIISFKKHDVYDSANRPSIKPKSILYKPEYASSTGTERMKKRFGNKVFDTVKSLQLYKDIIFMFTCDDSIILDAYAGFGTSGEAVIELNVENESKKSFILINNDENNICEEITYKNIELSIEEIRDKHHDNVFPMIHLQYLPNITYHRVKLQ